GRVPHHLARVVLRVETAVWLARRLASRRVLRSRRGHRVLAERANGGELRVLLDLDAPALVLGERPVEHIELVKREKIEVLEDELLRHEVPPHVEMAPAPSEARPILDLKRRYRPGRSGNRGAPVNVGREELAQCLRAVAYPGRFGSADRDLVSGDGEAIALFAETPEGGVEGERDARPGSGADWERQAGRGTELIAKELGGNAHVIARRDRCRRAERERARSGRELRRNGNQGRGGHHRPSYRLRALPRAVDADDRLTLNAGILSGRDGGLRAPVPDDRDRRRAQPEEQCTEDHHSAEDRDQGHEEQCHEADKERKPDRHGPPRDPQKSPAHSDGGHRNAQRECDAEQGEHDETDPPSADQSTDREEDDREDRQADEHERADSQSQPRRTDERFTRAAGKTREEEHDEDAEDEETDKALEPFHDQCRRARKERRAAVV